MLFFCIFISLSSTIFIYFRAFCDPVKNNIFHFIRYFLDNSDVKYYLKKPFCGINFFFYVQKFVIFFVNKKNLKSLGNISNFLFRFFISTNKENVVKIKQKERVHFFYYKIQFALNLHKAYL